MVNPTGSFPSHPSQEQNIQQPASQAAEGKKRKQKGKEKIEDTHQKTEEAAQTAIQSLSTPESSPPHKFPRRTKEEEEALEAEDTSSLNSSRSLPTRKSTQKESKVYQETFPAAMPSRGTKSKAGDKINPPKLEKRSSFGLESNREIYINAKEFIAKAVEPFFQINNPLSLKLGQFIAKMDAYNNRGDKNENPPAELIDMHAQARLLLFLHMGIAYSGLECQIDWLPAKKQFYIGSEQTGTEACHHSLFAEVNDTYLYTLKESLLEAVRALRENQREIPLPLKERLLKINVSKERLQKTIKAILDNKIRASEGIENLWKETFPSSPEHPELKKSLVEAVRALRDNQKEIPLPLKERLLELNVSEEGLQKTIKAILDNKIYASEGIENLWKETFPLSIENQALAKDSLFQYIEERQRQPQEIIGKLQTKGIPRNVINALLKNKRLKRVDVNVDEVFKKWVNPSLWANTNFYFLNHHTLIAPSALNKVDDLIEKKVRSGAMKILNAIAKKEISPLEGTQEVGKLIIASLGKSLKFTRKKIALVTDLEKELEKLGKLFNGLEIEKTSASHTPLYKKLENLKEVQSTVNELMRILDALANLNHSPSHIAIVDFKIEQARIKTMQDTFNEFRTELTGRMDKTFESRYQQYRQAPFFQHQKQIEELKITIEEKEREKEEFEQELKEKDLTPEEKRLLFSLEENLPENSTFLNLEPKEKLDLAEKLSYGEAKRYEAYKSVIDKFLEKTALKKGLEEIKRIIQQNRRLMQELGEGKEPEDAYFRTQYLNISKVIIEWSINSQFRLIHYPMSSATLSFVEELLNLQSRATFQLAQDLEQADPFIYEEEALKQALIRRSTE
ncbi:hypothetical protein [Candidatus Protochlamydia amoebophila]|uniref:Uncharacterized protein n=1 Tax=Protochlamydia amoebophila (strain UWE25) TaxID=264201 RepID=A0A2P9HA31_PARUW|nr:hypothetical protein [Candidatus Protochlamydia amoebophila]SPJ31841.1 unnamed protein product [Candidatus Protochlamydia amoebophila UWE25]